MYDPISQDPPHNSDFPASMSSLTLSIADDTLNGVIYHPAGEGAHPLILLLHGWPGHERNLDLAQILRRAGYATCVFHYRGSWGSGGSYRFSHILDDVKYALDHFRDSAIAKSHRIDPDRIITIGHSLGGWASLMTAANGHVDTAASLSHANIGLWGQQLTQNPDLVRPMLTTLVDNSAGPLHGATADAILSELETHHPQWDLTQHATTLADKNLLIVGAKRDTVVSVFDHHMPVIDALKAADAHHLTTELIAADHSYNGNRIELARTILAWLDTV